MQLYLDLVSGLTELNSWQAVSQVGLRFLQFWRSYYYWKKKKKFYTVASIVVNEVGHADRASCPAQQQCLTAR